MCCISSETVRTSSNAATSKACAQANCGVPAYGRHDFKIYSRARPEFYHIYRVEYGEDIIMSKPLGIDCTQSLAFEASGPQLSRLFDSAQFISIAALPWTRREVWLDSRHA